MESPQAQHSLATDSFSHSWLSNPISFSSAISATLDHVDDHLINQTNASSDQNFHFNVRLSESIVHADMIFSNGIIIPSSFVVDPSKEMTEQLIVTTESSSSCLNHDDLQSAAYCTPSSWRTLLFPRKRRASCKDIMVKLLGVLKPACWCVKYRTISSRRRSTRVDDIDRRSREVKRGGLMSTTTAPLQTSSTTSSSASYCSKGNWSDSESSIHEAILYCKKCSGY